MNIGKNKGMLTALCLALLMAVMPTGAVMAAETTEAAETIQVEVTPESAAEGEELQVEVTEESAAEGENAPSEEFVEEDVFAEWNPEAPALNTLIEYVESVTDEASPDYIPPVDRIAVFDMDGTLCAELNPTYLEYYLLAWRILKDPTLEPDAEMLAVGRAIRDCALDDSFPDDFPMQHAVQAARAYAGMTMNEFSDFVTERLLQEADGFEGMTYGETFYQPMIEVVEYLQENDFKVYICSGSDRFICRTFIEGAMDIPYENIIGMDVALEATGQGDTDGLDYVFTAEDDLIRTDQLLLKNLKTNKVLQIAQEIGRKPVLSFGNSSGDVSMHMYTISNNPYKSAAFMLIADDGERDYGNPEKGPELRAKWEENGFNVISMHDDFKTIYGEDVVKTGIFTWLEDLKDERGGEATEEAAEEPAEEAAGAAAEEPVEEAAGETVEEPVEETAGEAAEDTQYVLYLGTNDKDTNEPVFTPDEAKEKAKEILIENLGGYTIQEANGGWVDDDGTEYQEYTLVIYLSDTTEEMVHSVADQLIEAFNQSSVMIQENPTNTEFYDGAK